MPILCRIGVCIKPCLRLVLLSVTRLDNLGDFLAVAFHMQLEIVQLDFEVAGSLEFGQIRNGDVAIGLALSLARARHLLESRRTGRWQRQGELLGLDVEAAAVVAVKSGRSLTG